MTNESAHSRTTTLTPPTTDGVTVRRVKTLAEYQECVAIQHETWGESFGELVPAAILMVSQRLSGVCAAAFAPGGRMLGFVFGMTGTMDGSLVHWSDLLAVRPEARGRGLGERLKRYQRDLVRAVGVKTMYWTFDPLVARNAHLNLERLGARAVEYVPDMYGSFTGSPLHGTLPTDRFVAKWDLTAEERIGEERAPRPPVAGVVVNPPASGAVSALPGFPDADVVRVVIPRDFEALEEEERATWRAVTRQAFQVYLARGYHVAGFRRGSDAGLPYYELARAHSAPRSGKPR